MARKHLLRTLFLLSGCALGVPLLFSQVPTPRPNLPPPPGFTAKPALPASYYDRYGNIVAASDDPTHPVKLNIPGPSVGEVHIPRPEELEMRMKLERLSLLSDQQIRAELEKWPPYTKMSLGDQGAMLQRIQQFKDYRTHRALDKQKQLGLTLSPSDQQRFENEYWMKKLAMDRQLAQQFQVAWDQQDQLLNEQLFRTYSRVTPLPPPAPKPATKPVTPSLAPALNVTAPPSPGPGASLIPAIGR